MSHTNAFFVFGATLLVVGSSAFVACDDHVVQTARRAPPTTSSGGAPPGDLDCSTLPDALELPRGAAFGEGQGVVDSPLVGSTYEAQSGPGLFVAARDAFRLYVNGELVRTSESAREIAFVPLTLLPGENVIAFTVQASAGLPLVLAHLDELDRRVTTGSDWRMSRAPEEGWTNVGFDDSGWELADEFGLPSDLPGCDPGDSFPASTDAHWIGASSGEGPIALRRAVRVRPSGFGAGTTGGFGVTPVVASSWAELEDVASSVEPAVVLLAEGTHDYRLPADETEETDTCPTACANDPTRSTYRVLSSDETCSVATEPRTRFERTLRVGSNKTIVGLGRGAILRGVSFDLDGSENVIVRNVAVTDVNPSLQEAGDAFTLTRAKNVWFDHVTVRAISDAFADVLAGTRGLTVSWSHFDGRNDAECEGRELWAFTATDTELTVHHCRFEEIDTRATHVTGPAARGHLHDDVFSNVSGWAVGSTCGAQVLLETSYFENAEAATRRSSCEESGAGLFLAVPGSNVYRDTSAVHLGGDGEEPDDSVFSPPYEYTTDRALDAFPAVLAHAGAGGRWALPFSLE